MKRDSQYIDLIKNYNKDIVKLQDAYRNAVSLLAVSAIINIALLACWLIEVSR